MLSSSPCLWKQEKNSRGFDPLQEKGCSFCSAPKGEVTLQEIKSMQRLGIISLPNSWWSLDLSCTTDAGVWETVNCILFLFVWCFFCFLFFFFVFIFTSETFKIFNSVFALLSSVWHGVLFRTPAFKGNRGFTVCSLWRDEHNDLWLPAIFFAFTFCSADSFC